MDGINNKNNKNENKTVTISFRKAYAEDESLEKYLIKLSQDVEDLDTLRIGGHSILAYSVIHNYRTLIRCLIFLHNVDVTANNNEALILAATYCNYDQFKLLCENGADPRARNDACIKIATSKGYESIYTYLIKNKLCDVNAGYGEPLLNAVERNDLNLFSLLVSYGADIDIDQDRALSKAISYDNKTLVSMFIKYGANFRRENDKFLNDAVTFGYKGMVRLLLVCGAKASSMEYWALKQAKWHGLNEILDILISFIDIDKAMEDANDRCDNILQEILIEYKKKEKTDDGI
ncbi:MAG: ankyrin repeat domain-containing protein [Clostridia bacterium]|nr:ankyrin repeat domain-containing protein [Clostridia bacterium]